MGGRAVSKPYACEPAPHQGEKTSLATSKNKAKDQQQKHLKPVVVWQVQTSQQPAQHKTEWEGRECWPRNSTWIALNVEGNCQA